MLFPAYSLDFCPVIPQEFFFQNMSIEYLKVLEQKQELEEKNTQLQKRL